MKKTIFIFTLVLATSIIYGYSRSKQNEPAENKANLSESKDMNRSTAEINKPEKAQGSKPGILIILTADKSKPGWSSSFLRNYIYGNTNQAGC